MLARFSRECEAAYPQLSSSSRCVTLGKSSGPLLLTGGLLAWPPKLQRRRVRIQPEEPTASRRLVPQAVFQASNNSLRSSFSARIQPEEPFFSMS